MTKITLLGTGSSFTQSLFTDILSIPDLNQGVIGLVDIDAARLDLSARLIRRLLKVLEKSGWHIQASADRRRVLPGTTHLINTIEVSGVRNVRFDNDIPLKYGIDQSIADTIGPGGIMKALRTVPRFLEILDDAKRLCPEALVLNYTNPMSIMTLAAHRSTRQPVIGLCHSVQSSSRQLAQYTRVPYEEMTWKCGGINHMAWFTELKYRGRDLYPALRALVERGRIWEEDRVRFETMLQFGYFVTESSSHFSEYVPYFRKRPDLIKRFAPGSSGAYARNWPRARKDCDRLRTDYLAGHLPLPTGRSYEYAAEIIEGHIFDRRKIVHGSVPNTGLIPNLSQTGVVEVAVLVDRHGFTPTYFGPLPEQVAALCRSNMAVYELCVQGILGRDREAIIHAMMLDPLTSAVCSLDEIRAMAEELLFRAEQDFIPAWCRRPAHRAAVPLPRRVVRGFDRFWLLGPFDNVDKKGEALGLSQRLPPEEQVDLKARYAGKGGRRIGWQRIGPREIPWQGYVDLLKLLGPVENAVAYAWTVIDARTASEMIVDAGSDDGIAVWLNGVAVCCIEARRGAWPGQDKLHLQLRPGRNELLIKVDQKDGEWGFYADVKDWPAGVRIRLP